MPQRRTTCLKPHSRSGFTLIELAVTVSVIGIVATIAIPGMQALINANRLSGASGELAAALQTARSEAIRRNARVTVCGSTDGATCANTTAWTQVIVRQPNGTANDPAVVNSYRPTGSVEISGPLAGIVFRPSGQVMAQGIVNACVPTGNPNENLRRLTVMVSGGVRTDKVNNGGACP